MAFTQEPINYAQQYARELANAYPYLNYFGAIYSSPNSSLYRPVSGQTVLIPSMSTAGSSPVNRNQITGVINRNFNLNYEPKQMGMYRKYSTIIDPMDIVETNDVATIANVTKTYNEFQKPAEMDCYAASRCYSFAAQFGGTDATSLTEDNILATWDGYIAYMTSQRVNRDRVIAYMTPATYKLLKEAAGITRFIDTGTGIRAVDRNVAKLDGVTIREVPPDLMQTAYLTDQDGNGHGFDPAPGAQQINMLLVDPMATIAPIVYDVSMVSQPSAYTEGKTVYFESYYYDVFALNQRQSGFFANVAAPDIGTVTVTSVAGSGSGNTVVTYSAPGLLDSNGNPYEGIDVYYSVNASAPVVNYGAALPTSSSEVWTKCSGQNPLALSGQTASQHVTIGLVNRQTGFAIAAGSATIVTGS